MSNYQNYKYEPNSLHLRESCKLHIFKQQKITIIKEMTYITTEVKSRVHCFEPL